MSPRPPIPGWLPGLRHCPSPNADLRPPGQAITLIVLHAISLPPEQFYGDAVERLFTNRLDCDAHPYYHSLRNLHVSAHLFIRRDGDTLQFVPLHARAWHAGLSRWRGCERCNDFSIGIELEGSDTQPFTDAQYTTLATRLAQLIPQLPDIQDIAGHADIAPTRKTDPGPHFDWPRLHTLLARLLSSQQASALLAERQRIAVAK